jgi:hypothetical protein
MRKAITTLFAVFIALISAWVLLPFFDLPPIPFFFIDEAIALILLTKSLAYLGIDITHFIPFLKNRKQGKKPTAPDAFGPSATAKEPVIDV